MSITRPDRPWSPPSPLYNVYRVFFPGVKRPGLGFDQSLPSSAEVKERVGLYLYSPSGPSCTVPGGTLPFLPSKVCLSSGVKVGSISNVLVPSEERMSKFRC